MREPDALDAARVLALALVALCGGFLLSTLGLGIAASVFQEIAFLAAPLLYARWAKLRPLAASGFAPLPLRRLACVLMASLGSFWLLNGLVHLQTLLFRAAGLEELARTEEELIRQGILATLKQGALPAFALLVVVPPLCEEVFFRGILFRGLLARFGAGFALTATSLLFAAFHAALVQKGLMVCLGLYFGFLAYLTGSLWAGILAHALNNFAVLTLTWIYGERLPDFAAPWWMTVLSAVVFGLAMTLLVLDRPTATISTSLKR